MFKALVLNSVDGKTVASYENLEDNILSEGDVTVDVRWSTLNYKDALAITGASPVVRKFPMIPGIDFGGVVVSSSHPRHRVGDSVVLNGWGVGETHWGGLAARARVNGDWLVPLQEPFSLRDAMAIGTAGYTAMLCIMALERNGVTPDKGEVLVTGASGGVGSVAVAVLAKLGYSVVAMTGRPEEEAFLENLGASRVLDRSSYIEKGRPLAKESWAGAIDVVGGNVLANVCASTKYGGTVAACGLAGTMDFPATVAPFILRGVTLAGVDSVMCPIHRRLEAWKRLATDLDVGKLRMLAHEVAFKDVISEAPKFLSGMVRGRVIVDIGDQD